MSVIGPIHKAATGHTLGAISQINVVQEGLVGKFEEVAFSIIGIILFGFTGRVELVHREVLELRVRRSSSSSSSTSARHHEELHRMHKYSSCSGGLDRGREEVGEGRHLSVIRMKAHFAENSYLQFPSAVQQAQDTRTQLRKRGN